MRLVRVALALFLASGVVFGYGSALVSVVHHGGLASHCHRDAAAAVSPDRGP